MEVQYIIRHGVATHSSSITLGRTCFFHRGLRGLEISTGPFRAIFSATRYIVSFRMSRLCYEHDVRLSVC